MSGRARATLVALTLVAVGAMVGGIYYAHPMTSGAPHGASAQAPLPAPAALPTLANGVEGPDMMVLGPVRAGAGRALAPQADPPAPPAPPVHPVDPPAPPAPPVHPADPPAPPVDPPVRPADPNPPGPAANGPDAAAPKPGDVLIDAWYGQYQGDNKTGWAHILGTKTASGYDVVETYASRSSSSLTGVTHASETSFRSTMDADFGVITSQIDSNEAGQRKSRTTVTREGSLYTFVTELEGRKTVRTCTVDAPVIGSNDLQMQRWLATGKLVAGFTASLREFDYGGARVNARELSVRLTDSGEVVCAFDQIAVTLDARGIVRLFEEGSHRMIREDEAIARALPEDPPRFTDKLTIDVGLPNPSGFDTATVELDVEGYTGPPIIPDTEYQRSTVDPARPSVHRVEMRAVRLPDEVYPDLGFATKGFEEFLRPDALRQCDAPEIVAKAKEIVGTERNSLAAVRKLVRWIHVQLDKEYTTVGDLTALATLAGMKGDCSEHAILFDAFARSLGIPVRECSGYVFFDTQGGSHAWSQVWLGTRWLHVDCVAGEVGTGPQYILFWQQNATGEYDKRWAVRRGALVTHSVSCRLIDVTVGGRTTPVGNLESLVRRRGRWLINELMGVAVELPDGWEPTEGAPPTSMVVGQAATGQTAQLVIFGNHPLALIKHQLPDAFDAFAARPTRRVAGAPAWKMPGWRSYYVIEHPAGSLIAMLGYGRDNKSEVLLDHLRFDVAALVAELDAAEAKTPKKK